MNKRQSRLWLAVGTAVIATLAVLSSGLVAAAIIRFGWWSWPFYFLSYMAVSAGVLAWPLADVSDEPATQTAWQRFVRRPKRRLQQGRWLRWRQRGSWFLAVMAAGILGPLGTGFAVRLLKLSRKSGWWHCVSANLLASVFWVSVYLGTWSGVVAAWRQWLN